MQTVDGGHETVRFEQNEAADRPVGRSIRRGMLNTCPACGSGRLFKSFLKTVETCASCGERLDHRGWSMAGELRTADGEVIALPSAG